MELEIKRGPSFYQMFTRGVYFHFDLSARFKPERLLLLMDYTDHMNKRKASFMQKEKRFMLHNCSHLLISKIISRQNSSELLKIIIIICILLSAMVFSQKRDHRVEQITFIFPNEVINILKMLKLCSLYIVLSHNYEYTPLQCN